MKTMIQKIIHQTGPTNKQIWHPLWNKCQSSWKQEFPTFEYRFWSDEEIDDLIKSNYAEYYQTYSEFPVHIMKIDFIRFCIMHSFGGIYCDLDFFCYKNFGNYIKSPKNSVWLVENPFGNDPIENSLMISSEPGHPFWLDCMNTSIKRFNETKTFRKKNLDDISIISSDKQYGMKLRPHLVFHLTGTNLISSVYRKWRNKPNTLINTLSGRLFNNLDTAYFPEIITRHCHTGVWGKENLKIIEENNNKHYDSIRGIPLHDFDFYTDYSNGQYIKTNEILHQMMNWDRNDIDGVPELESTEFTYC